MLEKIESDTICALSTAGGSAAIAVIRLSGHESLNICSSLFSKNLKKVKTQTIHYGTLVDEKGAEIDKVTVSVFKNPISYTGEDIVEISCHGSLFIQQKILQTLIKKGARIANPGEFTMRAFKNGKMDLSQAESVADLINAESDSEHQVAFNQLKGGFSQELNILREKLLNFASLIELELDFSEEDVEFADRERLMRLLVIIKQKLKDLTESYKLGNVMKNGINIAIVGSPNVGKSTLLNSLLNEERAIVSKIPGTTRDSIEETLIINGIRFRFTDTAGIRETKNKIESIGIKKSMNTLNKADIALHIIDISRDIKKQKDAIEKSDTKQKIITVYNKVDLKKNNLKDSNKYSVNISAKHKIGIDKLKGLLCDIVNIKGLSNKNVIITNNRHYEQLSLALTETNEIINGIENSIESDFLSIHVRQALFHIGSITGEVSTDDLLGNIFSKFCIGK